MFCLGVHISMKSVKWLIIGLAMAAVIGFILFEFWNVLVGIIAAVVIFVLFTVVIFAGGGFRWDHNEDEDDNDEDDEDDDDRD